MTDMYKKENGISISHNMKFATRLSSHFRVWINCFIGVCGNVNSVSVCFLPLFI